MFQTIAIYGLGMMGGSLLKLIRQKQPQLSLLGISSNPLTLKKALEEGLVDDCADHPAKLNKQADLMLICTPMAKVDEVLTLVSKEGKDSLCISDISSVKADIGMQVPLKPGQKFIQGHPMAGIEKQGFDAADASILDGATYVLSDTESEQGKALAAFLSSLGFNVIQLNSESHDKLVALSSHFPFLMSGLTVKAAEQADMAELKNVISSGFRDTTRVADSAVDWGLDISQYNKENLLGLIDATQQNLSELKILIENEDQVGLKVYFEHIKRVRQTLID